MQTLLLVVVGISVVLLIVVASVKPRHTMLSNFELARRRDQGSSSASEELAREVLLDDVASLLQVASSVLLVGVVVLSVATFGIWLGIVVALVVALMYGRIARVEVIHTFANRIYEQWETPILRFVERVPRLMSIMRTVSQSTPETELSSREELQYLVDRSGHILTDDEKKLITNGLSFNETRVESIMTPRGVVETTAKDDLVGPVLLDELHKTGHSRFPVIDGDIDHVVGVLHIKDLLTLGDKETKTAGKAMEPRVYYINQDQTLDHALAAFIKTRHHLFIVVNGYRETAGILTMEDVMEALLGREIVDEFDVHDDLRLVAARNAKSNNNPPHATNI